MNILWRGYKLIKCELNQKEEKKKIKEKKKKKKKRKEKEEKKRKRRKGKTPNKLNCQNESIFHFRKK